MSKRKIHIGNLQIRFPRGAGTTGEARAIAGGLGQEILQSIAESTSGKTGTRRIGQISAGKITSAGGTVAQDLQKQIARRVADELRKKIG
jgi:hypothetical protein